MATLKVLVVDDEPGIRSGIRRILKNFKVDYPFMNEYITFDVKDASTGEEALEIISGAAPDILLLDNKLPGMQGIEVLEEIKKGQINCVVAMITSFASLELAVNATRDGAHDFIPKPFTPQELRASIETITKHIFLKRMTEKLHEEGKHIRYQFLSVLSHELKAPINAIEGYVNMLKEKQMGPEIEAYDQIIERTLKRINGMRSLIMDMLDLTRVETGNLKKNIETVNLYEAAGLAVDVMQPYAIQKEVAVTIHGPKEIAVTADKDDIDIIFNNLISNAIKYNKQHGQVDITLRSCDENISIQVADTGIGMHKTEMSCIFDDFVRIKNPKTKTITGSGLGLSIVKKLTESYNGEINVCSKPEEGSIFTVTFPKK